MFFYSRNESQSYFEYAPKTVSDALDRVNAAVKLTQPVADLLMSKKDIWTDTEIPYFFGLLKSPRYKNYLDHYRSSWSGLMIGTHRVTDENKKPNDVLHSKFWNMLYELYCNRNHWKNLRHIREKIGAVSIHLTVDDKNTLQDSLTEASQWTPEKVEYMLHHLNHFDPVKDVVNLP